MEPEETTLRPGEVALMLKVSLQKVRTMAKHGELPGAYWVGSRGLRFRADEIERFVKSGGTSTVAVFAQK